jgi:hypothetical protein
MLKLEEFKSQLEALSIDQLINVKNEIEELIKKKKEEIDQEYEFDFEATDDPRKGVPYVAKLFITEDGKLEREFFKLDRIKGKKSITVSGKFKAKEGDIIEIRWGGSWKNEYRYWYIVHDKDLCTITDIDNSKKKEKVIKYLKRMITKEDILKEIEE